MQQNTRLPNEHQGFAKLHPNHTVEKVVQFRPISAIKNYSLYNDKSSNKEGTLITLKPVEGMNSLQAKTAVALSPIYETGQLPVCCADYVFLPK